MTTKSDMQKLAWDGMKKLNEVDGGDHVRAIYDVLESAKAGSVYTLTVITFLTRLHKENIDFTELRLEQCEVSEEPFDVETYRTTFDESSNEYTFTKIDSKRTTPENFVRSLLFQDD